MSEFTACQDAIQNLLKACPRKGVADLCARSEDPKVKVLGTFDTCDDDWLRVFWDAISRYNQKIGFPEKPTYGPVRNYFYYADGQLTIGKCFQGRYGQIIAFFALSASFGILVACSLTMSKKLGGNMLAYCDITMDVSRSRAFTVSGTLRLLSFFYRFNLDVLMTVKLKMCTKIHEEMRNDYSF